MTTFNDLFKNNFFAFSCWTKIRNTIPIQKINIFHLPWFIQITCSHKFKWVWCKQFTKCQITKICSAIWQRHTGNEDNAILLGAILNVRCSNPFNHIQIFSYGKLTRSWLKLSMKWMGRNLLLKTDQSHHIYSATMLQELVQMMDCFQSLIKSSIKNVPAGRFLTSCWFFMFYRFVFICYCRNSFNNRLI